MAKKSHRPSGTRRFSIDLPVPIFDHLHDKARERTKATGKHVSAKRVAIDALAQAGITGEKK